MAGKKAKAPDAMSMRWRKKVNRLARDLGYEERGIWYWFEQIALARRDSAFVEIDPLFHEEAAYRDCMTIFDDRGRDQH